MLFIVSEHCNVLAFAELKEPKFITEKIIPIDEPTFEFSETVQDDICASRELPTVTLTISNVDGSTAQRVVWTSFPTYSERCNVEYKLTYHKRDKPTETVRHTFQGDGEFQTGNLLADTEYSYELKLSKRGLANSLTRRTVQTLRTHKIGKVFEITRYMYICNALLMRLLRKIFNNFMSSALRKPFKRLLGMTRKKTIAVGPIESGENYVKVKWGKIQPGNAVRVTVYGALAASKQSMDSPIRVGGLDACKNYYVLVELLNGNEVVKSNQPTEVKTSYPALNAPENFIIKSLSGELGHKLTWTPMTTQYPSACRLSYRVERESRKGDKVEKQSFALSETQLEVTDIAHEVEYFYKVQAVFNLVHGGKFSETLKITALSSKLNNFPKYSLIGSRASSYKV
ncbi:hypothetical protein T265_11711 [Opisthorchis viverrini]|uniref:Fibronectin type-III domain-containing protein n=1 Tax=Opisthorchis viverrini TaxID=6198 RepID=A0A074Z235_OPIVI|nr:hypothetical protein T265_11711 [Opisthorchis viverrini]KER19557.1 hypothetical protein T265_11711 [Opisthorchis viverrini]